MSENHENQVGMPILDNNSVGKDPDEKNDTEVAAFEQDSLSTLVSLPTHKEDYLRDPWE
jgi:hypothetical protein